MLKGPVLDHARERLTTELAGCRQVEAEMADRLKDVGERAAKEQTALEKWMAEAGPKLDQWIKDGNPPDSEMEKLGREYLQRVEQLVDRRMAGALAQQELGTEASKP